MADWLLSEFNRQGGILVQRQAAETIRSKFGEEFTYHNDNGNLAIDPIVLAEFRKLTTNSVVWENFTQRWRARLPSDDPDTRKV